MRVISGKAKGRRLLSVPGEGTRAITDRVKSALFSILVDEVPGARLLDLFGGTGSVGIEALSRGARQVVFVERSAAALHTLGENLHRTGLADGAQVVRGDAFRYLARGGEPFDIIYVAPPQYQGLWKRALRGVDQNERLLTPHGQVVVQVHPKEWEPLDLTRLRLTDQRQYGSTLLCFYRLLSGDEEALPGEAGQIQGEADAP
ncbi:MAG: 16S rRNA (guanine(966)-N(2))-methyltransferase RsmD [Chloroflexi bacterium]|nr:16S rRNA (guanine(966)-N(2))-methyltransferase RsmD [Chloroflexota bacterium]